MPDCETEYGDRRRLMQQREVERDVQDQRHDPERHLKQHGRVHSGREWRLFSEARLKAKYQRARCC